MSFKIDYSEIKSAAAVEELVRRSGAFLLVGFDEKLHRFPPKNISPTLISCIEFYATPIKKLLRERAIE